MNARVGLAGLTLLAALGAHAAPAEPQPDVVVTGVRAIDPETHLDATRNIGIRGGQIVAVTEGALLGRRMIDGRGLVAAPGFIDLHSHAYGYETSTYQAMDGVTTRLELEIGVFPVKSWYARKAGHELLNYGASVNHVRVRYALQHGGGLEDPRIRGETFEDMLGDARFEELIHAPIPASAYGGFVPLLEAGLDEGAVGIGSGTQYAPGISRQEMLDLTRVAAQRRQCVFTHIRYGSLVEPGSTLEAVQEQIANAAITGACVHIVHINSMAMSATPQMIGLMHGARERGVDISTEIYPWDASSDSVRSVIFDAGWEQRWGVTPHDLQSTVTGERLTREQFDALRAGKDNDGVLMHMNTEQTLIQALQDPLVLVASDSGDIEDGFSHPRSAGTFGRILGRYVRETHALTLLDAVQKMSLMPAQRLEGFVPAMKKKGRLQAGADADLVLFDPQTVAERARYLDAKQYTVGMRYVMVNGQFVVDRGKLVPHVYPGQPVRGTGQRP